ncbi:Do family serine endopeptidase [Psychrobium sp. 1_MG-2023]|uniref:Do family serine endopeptidase n=1 Tax=Psychrobium sp. 1_MG-2023 TaxID=3062624 RepID=UPI000C3220EF|nr:Do family serine endopeptidase [Psychrobium sp. 1_MG-2023]MDP2560690.1 Do family serine endopeptidase [Psychrobium sp. 1_MG-2023]PKF56745.1 serine endoprotease DegQ [Alteromonadales bacterium alter-6D02]
MTKKLSLISASLFALSIGFYPSTSQAAWPQSVSGQQLPSLAPMLEKVAPGVVSISVEGTHTQRLQRRQVPEMFRPFIGRGDQVREQPFKGLGSGVIIDAEEGYILTNHHVVNNADEIKISLSDGRQFTAKMIGSDPESDVALLQVEADNLTEVKKADSDELRVGDFTVAIGNPFGLGQTVTSGIVSALGRTGLNTDNYENFIQTDAAINSGNSGGALVNLKGELIGINTAIIGPNGGNVGIGFAIPINMADSLVNQILEFGEVRRGVLGIQGLPLTPELAKKFGLDTKHGAFVNQVMPDSAAEAAGLEAGDIIVKVDGRAIKTFSDLRAKIATMGAGTNVKLEVIRDGRTKKFKVKLKDKSSESVLARVIHPALSGAKLKDNSGKVKGVSVSDIERRSPAMQVGLEDGDVIIGVDRTRVKSLKELRAYLKENEGMSALRIKREDSVLYLILN